MNSVSSLPRIPTIHNSGQVFPRFSKPSSLFSKLTAIAFMALLATRGAAASATINNNTTAVIPGNNTDLANYKGAEIQTTAIPNNVGITAQKVYEYITTSDAFVGKGTIEDAEKIVSGDWSSVGDGGVLSIDKIPTDVFNTLLDTLATKGSSEDWFNRATEYHTGTMGIKDIQTAMKWYRKAAEANHARATAMLGALYHNGKDGVQKDDVQAGHYFLKAADLGDADAQYQLGVFYYEGTPNFKQNPIKAIEMFEKAALQNHVISQSALGEIFRKSPLVKQDLKKAVYWYSRSADGGNANAQYQLGDMIMQGLGGLEKNYPEAMIWLEKSANQDHRLAQGVLGLMYQVNGQGLTPNISKAIYWHEKASKNGIAHSSFVLAVIFHNKGIDELNKPQTDLDVAKQFFDKAIENAKLAQSQDNTDKETDDLLKKLYRIKALKFAN